MEKLKIRTYSHMEPRSYIADMIDFYAMEDLPAQTEEDYQASVQASDEAKAERQMCAE